MPAKRSALQKIQIPTFKVATESLGELELRGLTFNHLVQLEEAGKAATEDGRSFLNWVIRLVAEKGDGAHPTNDEIAALGATERERIAAALVKEHKYFFREQITKRDRSERGGIVMRSELGKTIVKRRNGETDEDYLLRGYEEFQRRFKLETAKWLGSITKQLSGFSDSVRSIIRPAWIENIQASEKIADRLKGITSTVPTPRSDPVRERYPGRIAHEPVALPEIEISPHPAHQTNAILDSVADDISDMRELTETAAEMQRSLNEVARTILTEFGRGAEASARASSDALEIARVSQKTSQNGLKAAVAGVIIALMAILVSIGLQFQSDRNDTAALRAENEARREFLKALNRNSAAIERQEARAEAISRGSLAPGATTSRVGPAPRRARPRR